MHGKMANMHVQCKQHRKKIPVFCLCNEFEHVNKIRNRWNRQIDYSERPFSWHEENDIEYNKLEMIDSNDFIEVQEESI